MVDKKTNGKKAVKKTTARKSPAAGKVVKASAVKGKVPAGEVKKLSEASRLEVENLYKDNADYADALGYVLAACEEVKPIDKKCVYIVGNVVFNDLAHTFFLLEKMHELRKNNGLKDPENLKEFIGFYNCVAGDMSQTMARLKYVLGCVIHANEPQHIKPIETELINILQLGKREELYGWAE